MATLLIALIFTNLVFFLALLTELKNVGEGDYDILQVMLHVLLRLPNELYPFSPLFMLLGSIVGLSILSSHKELALMRASGFSIRQILFSVLGAAFFLIVMITFLGEWLGPKLSYIAEIKKENAKNAGQAVVIASGVWFHVNNNFIHVNHVVDRQRLEGVTRYQFNSNHQLQAVYFAEQLSLQNHQWLMNHAVKTSFYHDRIKSEFLQKTSWNITFNPNLLNIGFLDPQEMSLSKLHNFIHYLRQNGLHSSEYEYEFWQRMFRPFASLIMIFLAIPFVLGILSTSTLGWRMMIGLLTGFAFFISNALLGQLCIVFQIPAIYAALLPLLGFAIVGMVLCKKLIRY
jgi:lipopolysaccharide export system permease protein